VARSRGCFQSTAPDERWLGGRFGVLLPFVFVVTVAGCRETTPPRERTLFFEVDPAARLTVELDGESRIAVVAPPAKPLRRRLEVPAARLDLAIGLTCPPDTSCPGERVFRVTAREDGGPPRTLLERRLRVEGEQRRWVEERIDLGPLGGRTVNLEFEVDPESAPARNHPLAVWADPYLVHAAHARPPNVLLVSIDTLRADRLGCYGYAVPTSPVLDALSRDGVRFARAISQSPWTTPSHLSMFTSLYPTRHGVNLDHARLAKFLRGEGDYPTLGAAEVTLAELLRRRGYRTLAITGGGPTAPAFGLGRGFDVYQSGASAKLREPVLGRLREHLEAYRDVPLFLFFHTFEVHAPYLRHDLAGDLLSAADREAIDDLARKGGPALIPGLRKLLEERGLFRAQVTSALYDGGVLHTDRFLGRLFEELRRLDLWERTIVVVTANHGEEFADHDPKRFYDAHCSPVHEELVHVPLLLRVPGRFRPGTVVEEPVELLDLAPTLLDLVGLPVPSVMQGESLVEVVEGGRAHRRWSLSEATCVRPEWKALRNGRYKYVAAIEVGADDDRSNPKARVLVRRLYDLARDPKERKDLAEEQPDRAGSMHGQLMEILAGLRVREHDRLPTVETDRRRLTESLRALGYVE
jgi:arylsulfatase A-like enzyme